MELDSGKHFHNDIYFGDSISHILSKKYLSNHFFHHYLKKIRKLQQNFPKLICLIQEKKNGKHLKLASKAKQKGTFYLDNSGTLAKNILNQVGFLQNIL